MTLISIKTLCQYMVQVGKPFQSVPLNSAAITLLGYVGAGHTLSK